jgi:hypothetical protein
MRDLNLYLNKVKNIKLYFFIIFITGWLIANDYGVNIDDNFYYSNGLTAYNYAKGFFINIFSSNTVDLSIYREKMLSYPVVFELFLFLICDLMNISESAKIYLVAAKINFIFFFISLILFYRIIRMRFNKLFLGVLGTTLIVFSPRIFSSSFFNTRDTFFLSLFICFVYFMYNFINKKNFKNIILLSLFSVFLVNTRILGIVPVAMFVLLYIFFGLNTFENVKKEIKLITLYIIFFILFTYCFWPYLWADPILNYKKAIFDIVKDHEASITINYYFGERISSNLTPWHYRIIWMIITTPVVIVLLSLIGVLIFSFKIFKIINQDFNKKNTLNQRDFLDIHLFCTILTTLFCMIKFNATQYGEWRHIYFLYPIIIYMNIIAINWIYSLTGKKIYQAICSSIILLNLLYVASWSFLNHPNQYIFFNFLSKNYSIKNFDLDSWGISHKQSLNYILEKDENTKINIFAIGFTSLKDAYLSLEENKKKRIVLSDLKTAKYIIDSKTKKIREPKINKNHFNKFYEIIVDKTPITTVYVKK